MTAQRYGWHDRIGGVEPGFSDAPAMQFALPLEMRSEREDASRNRPETQAQPLQDDLSAHLLQ